MIYLVNNLNIKKVLNKYLLGTCLTSYITRTIIYSAIMFFFFSSFNEFFQNPQYGATTFKDAYGHVFDFYFFNGFIGSYLTLMFMIENIITFLNMINKRNQELIYRVGRTNDFYKTYITRSLKAILCSGLIILLACVIVDIVIIAINFINTNEIMIFDPEYYQDHLRNIKIQSFFPEQYRLLISSFVLWIPAILTSVILFVYTLFFFEKVKNIILTFMFIVFLYILSVFVIVSFTKNTLFLIPMFPIMNIQSTGEIYLSYLSLLFQFIIVVILFKIKKRGRWDEI